VSVLLIGAGLAVSAVTVNAEVDVTGTRDVSQSTFSASVDVDLKEDACTAAEAEAAKTASVDNADAVADETNISTSVSAEHLDDENRCFLQQLSDTAWIGSVPASSKSGAVFLKSSWRQHLCRCPSCLVNLMYFCVA